MKRDLFVVISIIALAMTQGCKTPSRVQEKRQATNTSIQEESNDTTKTHRVTVTTVEKTPTGGTKTTVDETEEMVKKRKKEVSRRSSTGLEKLEKDGLTPTLYNIERKEKKDSMSNAVKMEKQKTKQTKAKTTSSQIAFIIVLSILIFITWPVVKRRVIKNY